MDKNKEPKINPRIYSKMIFNQGATTAQWGKDSLLDRWCWEN